MDVVTPLMQTLQAQANLDHTRAVTQDTTALATNRLINSQMLQNLLQEKVNTQNTVQTWAQEQRNDPRMAAVAPSADDSPQTALAKQAQRMQLQSDSQMGLATQIRANRGDAAAAEKLERDATNNARYSGYVSRAGLQQMQEANKQAGGIAGAMMSALESGSTTDPSSAYEQLQGVIPPEQFAQFRWDTGEDGSVIDGPLTRATLGMMRNGNITATKQVDLKNAYLRTQALSTWRDAQARLADARADAVTARSAAGVAGATGTDGVASAAPGGPGSINLMDPNTGAKFIMNKNGTAFKANDDGSFEAISPNAIPKNATRVGNIGTAGSRENVFNQRVIGSGNQAAMDLANVVKLPIDADQGIFSGVKPGTGLFDAPKSALANKVTTQDVQLYKAMATGFQRNLAAIESAGLMPSGALTNQMEAVMLAPGDTYLTKLSKLAQVRQIVETGMETVLKNPRISDSEKELARTITDRVQKSVPYTQSDIIELTYAPATTRLRDLLKPSGGDEKKTAPAVAPATAPTKTKWLSDGTPVNQINGSWVNSKTGEVWRDGAWQKP